jgi:hypothetical protein
MMIKELQTDVSAIRQTIGRLVADAEGQEREDVLRSIKRNLDTTSTILHHALVGDAHVKEAR